MTESRKKVLLFSTLNPYPFWAGSETYWFDFVRDERVRAELDFHICLADSPVTRKKTEELKRGGMRVAFYKHFNVNFVPRNLHRLADRLRKRADRTLPWFDRILTERCDLVWFNVAALADLQELSYAVRNCRQAKVPYYIILQHAYENFCPSTQAEFEAVREVATGARRFIFVSERNRLSLEKGIATRLENAFHSTNALSQEKITQAGEFAADAPVGVDETAGFICLGRFSAADKGQHLLIEALSGDEWRKRDWRLTFTGISEYGEGYLRNLTSYYEIDASKIAFQSFTENVFQAICNNDVLVMPSLGEGMPYAMIEGMACARPAVGTPVGGIPELIDDGKTGWLARTTDAADIAEALERAWRDRTKWEELGQAAQAAAAENRNEAKSHEDLLNRIQADLNG